MPARLTVLLPVPFLVTAPALAADKGYWEYRFTDTATNLAFAALIVFLLIVWRLGAFRAVAGLLDNRSKRIADELEDARALRDEAQKLLSEAETRQEEADADAKRIVAQAKADADALMKQSRKELLERVERRQALADARIARAEQEAVAEVRRAAADAATEAARRVLAENASGDGAGDFFDRAIAEIDTALKS